MSRYVVAALVASDLQQIEASIGARSPGAAERVVDDILDAFDTLGQYPEAGRARPELGSDVRSWPVGRYLILYRVLAAMPIT